MTTKTFFKRILIILMWILLYFVIAVIASGCTLSDEDQYLMDTNPKIFVVAPVSNAIIWLFTPENKLNLEKEDDLEGYSWVNKK